MENAGRFLVIAGLGLAVLGAVLCFAGGKGWLSWIGRLPGDIRVEGDKGGFYFPVVTCLIVSVVLSGLLALIRRFPMRQVIAHGWRKALDRYAESELDRA